MSELTQTFELVQRAQSGDPAALNRVFERYYPRLRPVIRSRLGPKLRASVDIEDIVQRAFISAIRKFDDFKMVSQASLLQWLAKIASNQIHDAIDHEDAQCRDGRREVPLFDLAGDDTSPSGALAASEDEERLESALSELDEAHRELIILRNYFGFGWDEVAREAHRPSADAARMAHGTAMAKLTLLVREKRGP